MQGVEAGVAAQVAAQHLEPFAREPLTRGQVLAEGNYTELSKDERVKEAYLGAGHA